MIITNCRDTVFIDEVDEHVTQNIPAFGLLSSGQKVAREIMRIQKRGRHLHWRVPARLLRWALSHSAQMRTISKPQLESSDDFKHDTHTYESHDISE